MAQMCTQLSWFTALLILGLFGSASAQTEGIAMHKSTHDAVQSCKALAEERQDRAKNLLQLSHGYNDGKEKHAEEDRPITFITVYDPFFETNLGTSSLWVNRLQTPHQWIVKNQSEYVGVSKKYAEAQAEAVNDLLVFLHPDVHLPNDFYENLMQKLRITEAADPNWGVLGAAGVEFGTLIGVSSLTDFNQTHTSGEDNLQVQSLDECLLVFRRSSPFEFDVALPGIDLYGMDIALSARNVGRKSYLLNVAVQHKMYDYDGNPVKNEDWQEKVHSPEYKARVTITADYFQQKWCSSGFLPAVGTGFYVDCNGWMKVQDMPEEQMRQIMGDLEKTQFPL